MRYDVTVDAKEVTQALAGLGAQMRRAMSRTLERVANDVQSDVRQGIKARFTVAPAKAAFVRNMVKRTREDRATPEKLEASVRIEGPQSDPSRRDILFRHEEGGTKHSRSELFFLPTKEIRRGPYDLPPRNLYPKALRLMDQRGIGGATNSVLSGGTRGKHRSISGVSAKASALRKVGLGGTFLVQYKDGGAGIYQRQGEGREGAVKLWSLTTRIRLPKRLHFYATAVKTVDTRWQHHLVAAIVDEVNRLG